jgi:branched-chain amino acid transport system substrate-binding protein
MTSKRRFLAGLSTALALTAGVAWAQAPKAGAAKPPIKIALITPISGALSSYGRMQDLLVKIAAEDINAKGGINGSQVVVETGDAQMDPGQAVLLFRKYANEGFFGVIGPISGTQWETISPLANQIGLPAINANAVKPGITVRPWTLRLHPADDTMIPEGFKAFQKAYPKVKKVVIVADVREASGKAGAEVFQKLAKDAGLQIAETVEFSTRATDLSPAAIRVKSHNPDAVLAVAFVPQALLLAKEFATQGVKVPVINTAILWPGPFVNLVGENGANWHVIGYSTDDKGVPGNANFELHQSVVKRAQQRADPSLGVPANVANWTVGYDALLLYADILRRNGMDGSTDPKKAREAIKNEFTKLKSFKGVLSYSIRDNGDGYIPSTLLVPDAKKKSWKFLN